MNIWIWPVTEENWPTVKSKNVWAVSTLGKGSKVIKGDKIIFYVRGTQYFQGIYEVISEWYPSKEIWHDGKKGISDLDLKLIQSGYANLHKLLPSLEFIERKKNIGLYLRGTPQGPANSGKPISEKDYKLILEELKLVQEKPIETKDKSLVEIEEFIELPDSQFIQSRIHKFPPSDKKNIKDIIDDVEKGRCAIPNFQRYFTWNRTQIEELWESIFQGYYVGSILLWRTKQKEFDLIPVHGAQKPTNPNEIILDGQQRITSLYYSVAAPDVPMMYTTKPYRFFVDLNAILDPTRLSSDFIRSMPTDEAIRKHYLEREIQFSKKLFPLSEFYNRNYTVWLNDFQRHLEEKEGFDRKESVEYYKQLTEIFDYVWSHFEIPAVILPDSMILDNVAEVFERINSKGTPLGVFDLLNARFIKYDVNLRGLWEKSRANVENLKKWYDDYKNEQIPRYILQGIALYKKGFCRRRELLNLDSTYVSLKQFGKEEFIKDWNIIAEYVGKSVERLTSQRRDGFGAINYDIIPYTVMVPFISAILLKIETRSDRPTCLKKLVLWYWCSVFGESYDPLDSYTELDYRRINEWFDNDEIPIWITQQIKEIKERDLNITQKTSAVYKGILCLISKNGALDFVRDDPPEYSTLEDHHIFPRSKAEKYDAKNSIDSILNRTLIDKETNRKIIGDKNPSEYLKNIMESQNETKEILQKRLSTHLISSEAFDCLLRDDFQGFIKAREKTIREEIMRLVEPSITNDQIKIDELLRNKENQKIEFKSSLRWDIKLNQQNNALEEIIVKEIASFMNSEGGDLIIGVDDNNKILGLEKDYSTLKKQDSDGFALQLTNIVNAQLDKTLNSLIEISFPEVDEKEICLCRIKKSSRPVFINNKNEKKFYVRMNNSSQPLDVEQVHKYIMEHWS